MFEPVDQKKSLYDMQEEILRFWKDREIFKKSIEQRSQGNRFSFYDGPPFITGIPHYATLLPSIAKDIVPRFQTMKGRRVRRVWGWDCHGLPAETKVEERLGIKSRSEIEEMGIGKFVEACRDYVSEVSSEWRWYVDHIGRWVDMDNAYRTMDRGYMETVIWIFKQLYEKGLIYEGVRSSLYCPRCATPLSKFEVTMDEGFYRDVEDTAVTIKFKIKGENKYLLAWTTTPWTLPSNRALAVDEVADYVEIEDKEGEKVILAEAVYERDKRAASKLIRKMKGVDLIGTEYEPLYGYGPWNDSDFQVYAGSFVTMEEGTGIVHIAPAFGEDDLGLGKKEGLSVFVSVDEEGRVTEEVPEYQGKNYRDANQPILDELRSRGLVFGEEKITHPYPFCYRCETPLIYKAQKAWYMKINELREGLVERNKDINWVPDYFKLGRFEYNLKTAPDWCLSRSRYWGTPIPVWKCEECGKIEVIGSVKEIEARAGRSVDDLHRPKIDEIGWRCDCGGEVVRVPEILDVWFESGAMPYAQWHYPFENEEKFKESYPADFVIEYTGQLRGWFYYLHVLGNALMDEPSFKNVLVTGVMKGNDGRKMSKSYGNYPDPKETIKKYGGETLRLYFMSSPIMRGEDFNVAEKDIVENYRKILMILWNSYRYFITYARQHQFKPEEIISENILDRWIWGREERMKREIERGLQDYDLMRAARAVRPMVEDLSTWYIRRSRERFVRGDREALETLYAVLKEFSRAVAPVLPFTAEAIYQNLAGGVDGGAEESVHLEEWPEVNGRLIEATKDLDVKMEKIRLVCYLGNSLRREASLGVRQTLSELVVVVEGGGEFSEEELELVKDELNVKEVGLVGGMREQEGWISKKEAGLKVFLNTVITEELRQEGLAREIIRRGQVLRKKAGYDLNDRIKLYWRSEKEGLGEVVVNNRDMIERALKADEVVKMEEGEDEYLDRGEEMEIDEGVFCLGVKLV